MTYTQSNRRWIFADIDPANHFYPDNGHYVWCNLETNQVWDWNWWDRRWEWLDKHYLEGFELFMIEERLWPYDARRTADTKEQTV
jgi:hypothetical protein